MAFLQPTSANGFSLVPSYESNFFVSGFEVTMTSATTLTISPGICRAYNNRDAVMVQPGLSINSPQYLTIDTTKIGVGGAFPISPTLASPTYDTGYGIYIVGDTSEVNLDINGNVAQVGAILCTGSDFLPQGYNVWCRLPGSVYVDAATNNMFWVTQSGSDRNREVMLQVAVPLATASVQTLTEIDLGGATNNFPINPNTVTEVLLQVAYTPAAAGNILSIAPTNQTTATPPVQLKGENTVQFISMVSVVPSFDATTGDAIIYYMNAGAGDVVSISLAGWRECANLSAI